MNPPTDHWARVTAAFDAALALDGMGREEFLTHLEQEEASIFKEVRQLLKSFDGEGTGFLENSIGSKIAQELFSSQPPKMNPGERIDDFEIVRELGSGSFATVYLARELSLNREVALKISPNMGDEAQTMAVLEHEHIVTVFSESTHPEHQWRMICMQYIPGCTLEKVLSHKAQSITGEALLAIVDSENNRPTIFNPSAFKDRETLSHLDAVSTVAWIGIRLADALEYAHRRGVLHLDIKPGNILVTPYGRPLLSDFNVAMNAQTRQGENPKMWGGTLNYMAPEQLRAFQTGVFKGVDERADIYALGTVLKEVLNGKTDESLNAVLKKCTASDPKDRYQTATDLSQALGGCLEHRSISLLLPKPGRFLKVAMKFPVAAMVLGFFLPQAAASAVNIAYNGSRIVSHLSLEQQKFFEWVCLWWNPLIFSVLTFILIKVFAPIYQFLRNPQKISAEGPEALAKVRQKILSYPTAVTFVTSIGWLIAAFLFPVSLDVFRGPVESWVYKHFFISFALSWLIAITYCFLTEQYMGIGVVYPKAWTGCTNIRATATQELKGLESRLGLFQYLTGAVPLFAALLLIWMEPPIMEASEFNLYKHLLLWLISAGMVGFFLATRASQQLVQTLHALTEGDKK